MDVDSVRRSQRNLSLVFAPLGIQFKPDISDQRDDELSEDVLPSSFSDLPLLSMLKEIGDKKSEVLKLRNAQDFKPIIKGFDKTQSLICTAAEFSQQVAECLQFLHKSCAILQQVLKDPMIQDSLPLPYHLHRKTVEAIQACIWMIQNKKWSPLMFQVDWNNLLPKLQQEVVGWVSSSRQSEKHLREVQHLKVMLDAILKDYPTLNYV